MPSKGWKKISDRRWLDAAVRLGERARPLSRPNPAVGCVIVRDAVVVGRGWTQPGGRPHAEAMALQQAGDNAQGATAYVSLEPCAHVSPRGPACSMLLAQAGVARVVIGCEDPDTRTAGKGIAALCSAGAEVILVAHTSARASLGGYFLRARLQRPLVTLKLALSLDGCIAMADGRSQWITGEAARAHTHVERARHDAILVGSRTLRHDNPRLNVRLPGLEGRSPDRWILTRGEAPSGWSALSSAIDLSPLLPAQYLMVEGGAQTAAAFLAAGHVDRLLIYRAPIIIGGGMPGIGDIGLAKLADSHGQWQLSDRRMLGKDTMEQYERTQCLQA